MFRSLRKFIRIDPFTPFIPSPGTLEREQKIGTSLPSSPSCKRPRTQWSSKIIDRSFLRFESSRLQQCCLMRKSFSGVEDRGGFVVVLYYFDPHLPILLEVVIHGPAVVEPVFALWRQN
ncbi:hypothetical protein TNCV_1987591 [Trichonephila clavipes]|uniref:Uncharacterized protein n=1 Tax=Trichonephila inaurata madagascariensis TaxID=2747483 RepID=A0A8X6XSK1_9ARAC|nr:hypothetical protein TNCV_1987591 [Trichonephila clavipes]GFY59452.1 hypothetical protein TNIN_241901 [Trichonephila inaurata madagascariensis]